MIKPSNGRIVWFTPPQGEPTTIVQHDINQPLTAQIVHVWGDRMVNLVVFDSHGVMHAVPQVMLLQDDDAKPSLGRFAVWMPYQKGQAAKTEQLEQKFGGGGA